MSKLQLLPDQLWADLNQMNFIIKGTINSNRIFGWDAGKKLETDILKYKFTFMICHRAYNKIQYFSLLICRNYVELVGWVLYK